MNRRTPATVYFSRSLIISGFLTIIALSPISAVLNKNRIEDDLADLRNRPVPSKQSVKSATPVKTEVTKSMLHRDTSLVGSSGKWTGAFVPSLPEQWSRRGKLFGLIGVGISTAVLYRLRRSGLSSPFSIFTRPNSNAASSSHLETEQALIAIASREDLKALQSELSEKDRALLIFDQDLHSSQDLAKMDSFAADAPFHSDYYFDILKSRSMGKVLLYSPILGSTQSTLFSQLETERQGLVCVADR